MEKAKIVIRILLGLIVLVFGLNKFLQFMPMPPMSGAAGEFMGALVKSGYMMPIVAIIEIIAGVLLLLNKYTSMALILLFPVLLNAFLFHFINAFSVEASRLDSIIIFGEYIIYLQLTLRVT